MVKYKAIPFAMRMLSQIHVGINSLFPLGFMFSNFKTSQKFLSTQYKTVLQ